MPWWRKLAARLEGRSALADGAVLVWLFVIWAYVSELPHPHPGLVWGCDITLYQQAVQSWFGGAAPYAHYQLAGPYIIEPGAILYPPLTLALFAPTLLLPLPLWWLLPIAITAVVIYRLRPQPWAMLVIAFCLLYRPSYELVVAGNPDIWLVAALAVAIKWRPAAAFVLLKPSVFVFAFVGMRSRGWWVIAGLMVLANLLLLPQALDWIAAVANGRGPRSGLTYSLLDFPLLCIPFIAWIGSTYRVTFPGIRSGVRLAVSRETYASLVSGLRSGLGSGRPSGLARQD